MDGYNDKSWTINYEQPGGDREEYSWAQAGWQMIGALTKMPIKMQIEKMKKKTEAMIFNRHQVTEVPNKYDILKDNEVEISDKEKMMKIEEFPQA